MLKPIVPLLAFDSRLRNRGMVLTLIGLLTASSAGCAGFKVHYCTLDAKLSNESQVLVMPFRNPSFKGTEYIGVGGRFTKVFTTAAARHGVHTVPIVTDEYRSDRDFDITGALEYAERKGADFIITGHVTKWIDRATEWNGLRDHAGLGVVIRAVPSGEIVGSAEIEEHSNVFWSGTPDDYVVSLSEKVAKKLFGG